MTKIAVLSGTAIFQKLIMLSLFLYYFSLLYFIADFTSGERYVALKKGNYYFRPSCAGLRFKWKYTAVGPGTNDRMSRAVTMTSGTTKRV